jgi:phenylpropionate dioxygenase-like ring-hydroxylating dioxygenase large terminal subunit
MIGSVSMPALDQLLAMLAEYLELDDTDCLSLPPAAYLSSEFFNLEIENIFKKSWLCVGRVEYVPNRGDYYTIDLLGDKLIIVRGEDDDIRALSSICRHRNMPIVQDSGNTRRFTCPYHAWTYATDGRLLAAPYMEGSQRFAKENCSLPQYRLEKWAGFLFVNFDREAPPLASRMHTLDRHIANYRVPEQTEILHYEAVWEGNWKLSAENSMEYYHHVGLHKDTVQDYMPAKNSYTPAPPEDLSFTHMRCGMNESFKSGGHIMHPQGRLDTFSEEDLTTGYLVYVWPAFTMAMRPNGNNWLSFHPQGPERTGILGGYMASPDLLEVAPDIGEQRREVIERVNEQDRLATSELAKAMHSSEAARGPLSPFEQTIAQFYRWLARELAERPE